MAVFTQSSFNATDIKSLCWRGDELVDWVGGGRAFAADGTERNPKANYGYRSDAATASPDGSFAAIYEKLGTKGLLLRGGKVLRELDRNYYHADAYEYPIALFNGSDGRVLLAHCPNDYCRIDIEDAETGRVLTESADRKPSDFFHSRLAASPNGKRLLSAGWVWHPLDLVAAFDLTAALANPHHLDSGPDIHTLFNPALAEESSACWITDDWLAIAASAEPADSDGVEEGNPCLQPRGLAVCNLGQQKCLRAFQLEEPAGTIFPIGTRFVLSLYRHPKLIDLSTGEVVHLWRELWSGFQVGSIVCGLDSDAIPPPMAFDPATNRFAIVNGDMVTRIEFNRSIVGADSF